MRLLDLGRSQQAEDSRVGGTGVQLGICVRRAQPASLPAPPPAPAQVRTTKQYARDATVVEASWLPELAPAYFARQHANAGQQQPPQQQNGLQQNGLQRQQPQRQNGRL